MAMINYNISSDRKVDIKRFIVISFILFVAAIVLLVYGINNIHKTNLRLLDKINKHNFYNNKTDRFNERIKKMDMEIKSVKSQWNSRVRFINGSIRFKTRSYLDALDFIEKALPDSVYVNDISLTNSSHSSVKISVVSESTDQLYKLYKKLIDHDLIILSENEDEGVYRAKLKIVLKK